MVCPHCEADVQQRHAGPESKPVHLILWLLAVLSVISVPLVVGGILLADLVTNGPAEPLQRGLSYLVLIGFALFVARLVRGKKTPLTVGRVSLMFFAGAGTLVVVIVIGAIVSHVYQ
jgi:hypothetical protein